MVTISTGQAFLIGLIGAAALISWIISFIQINRSLIVSALVGAVLKNTEQAIIFGAAAELLYLGLINAAGVVPPNMLGPGIFGVVIMSTTGIDVGAAIAISMPFAIFIQFLITLVFTVVSPVGGIGISLIQKEKFKLYRATGFSTVILLGLVGFVVGISAGLGYKAFQEFIEQVPAWLQTGLAKGGKMLPAMGFAVVLRIVLKKEFTPFLLVGYTFAVIFAGVGKAMPEWGFSLVAVAVAATAIALIVFNSGTLQKQQARRAAPVATEGGSDGI